MTDEAQALAALQIVQALSGRQIEERVEQEVGNAMLGVMKAVARAQFPGDEVRAVHLLVFGYLLHIEVQRRGVNRP